MVISNVVYLIHEINSDMATGDSYRRLIVSRTDTIDYGQIVVAGKISKCGAKTVSPTVVIA